MTLLLFFSFLLSISLLPVVIHKKAEGVEVPDDIIYLAIFLFLLSPIIFIFMILQYLVLAVFTVILGVFL